MVQYPKLVIQIRNKWKGQIRSFTYLYYYLPRKWAIKIWVSHSNDKEQNDSVNELETPWGLMWGGLAVFPQILMPLKLIGVLPLRVTMLYTYLVIFALTCLSLRLKNNSMCISFLCRTLHSFILWGFIYIYFNHILLSCQ